MKKVTTIVVAMMISLCSFSQKKDSAVVVQILMDTTQFKQAIQQIDKNVDSKSVSNWLIGVLTQNAQIRKYPANK